MSGFNRGEAMMQRLEAEERRAAKAVAHQAAPQRAGHTPGPWEMDRHEQLRSPDGTQIGVWGAGIAWVSRSDESEANARLIAAAPCMASLVERVAALNPDAGEIGAGMLAQLVTDARRIYARATGSGDA